MHWLENVPSHCHRYTAALGLTLMKESTGSVVDGVVMAADTTTVHLFVGLKLLPESGTRGIGHTSARQDSSVLSLKRV
jgi:hypothetical protein